MTLTEKIIEIVNHHGLDWTASAEHSYLLRTRAGRWQLARGTWKWLLMATIDTPVRPMSGDIGSSLKATDIAKCGKFKTEIYINRFGQAEILPTKEGWKELYPSADV